MIVFYINKAWPGEREGVRESYNYFAQQVLPHFQDLIAIKGHLFKWQWTAFVGILFSPILSRRILSNRNNITQNIPLTCLQYLSIDEVSEGASLPEWLRYGHLVPLIILTHILDVLDWLKEIMRQPLQKGIDVIFIKLHIIGTVL